MELKFKNIYFSNNIKRINTVNADFIDIVCCADHNYLPMTFVFLQSLIKNKYIKSKYRVYILLDGKLDHTKVKFNEEFKMIDNNTYIYVIIM
ncbi:hypothetical protein C3H57_06415 [Campylobacter jejuni]|uniref:Uncharacterized protein n=1 Tax=Campylobacter jejuni TaxID=197 RepID=A0A431ECH0_CAMJU|nr:hypothetical protein C3H68_04715 [Campylobacter jejuni]RTJ78943.1 hypothetical protein C3H57_06415 [Campylobacter jejuni]